MGGYLFSRKSDPLGQQALINNSLVNRFDKAEEKYQAPSGLFELTSGEASFPHISIAGEILYYLPKSGEIRSLSVAAPVAGTTLVAKIQPGASRIDWATNNTLLANYPTGAIFYDLKSNFSKKYDPLIKNPSLSRVGDKIAYTYFNPESDEGNISIADPRMESFKNILPTRFSGWQIKWLSDNKLALIKPPTLENTHLSLFTLNSESGALENILEFRNNLQIAWSENGQKILYSYTDPATQVNQLYFMDMVTKTEVSLGSQLEALKCAWSINGKTIYCLGGKSLFSFDTSASGTQPKEITSLDSSTAIANAVHPILTSIEDYIIFKSSKDGKLYGLKIN
ncbi:MAG: hypothetical protein A2831_02420 [Candidatus Yanofskybacteria bacterium RIFCSPHIGHO2_01_FULL_44_17]|uniref:Dipeptidylpeptidase IV N-terminal domain-containing protein n=1 Tax=Candidatus Yanofskybacteria bacterium RIFCSPHIGHO2_01_FULL_44_17 TaxID=1802668 RepID=A0A1F8ETS0_9BACT|nr:MAG: hypothetical protein A2831_02420 [Candidatus Yanofskybacteria bacterium RIFCSPHIGHO2_01_FULL_44_17]